MKFTESLLACVPVRLLQRIRLRRALLRSPGQAIPSLGFGSGKGGTGKTFVAINLAVLLARKFRGVQILDADLGLGNAHISLGLKPQRHFQHFFEDQVSLSELNLRSRYGVKLLPGGSGISRLANLERFELEKLGRDLAGILAESSVLVVDSSAGISGQTLRFLSCTDLVVLVVTPELTSLTDAYALLKCMVTRQESAQVLVLVNRVGTERLGREAFDRIAQVSRRFLAYPLRYLGSIPEDRAVQTSLAAKIPLVIRAPGSPAARALRSCAKELVGLLVRFSHEEGRQGFRLALLASL